MNEVGIGVETRTNQDAEEVRVYRGLLSWSFVVVGVFSISFRGRRVFGCERMYSSWRLCRASLLQGIASKQKDSFSPLSKVKVFVRQRHAASNRAESGRNTWFRPLAVFDGAVSLGM